MRGLFGEFDEKSKSEAVKKLIAESTPDKDFFFMIILSVLMATLGLLLDNIPILIGSMLIAPLLSPILSLALGIVIAEKTVISRSFFTILKAVIISVFLSMLVSFLFLPLMDGWMGSAYTDWSVYFVYFGVAVIAGLAASFSVMAPNINVSLPGSAIAVTLIPPVAAMGIGMAQFDWEVISGALIVFGVNALGIVFAALIMFSLMDLYQKKRIVQQAVEEEDELNHGTASTVPQP